MKKVVVAAIAAAAVGIFLMTRKKPLLGVSVHNGAIKATWNNQGVAHGDDWVGLYTPGSPDGSPIQWAYLSTGSIAPLAESQPDKIDAKYLNAAVLSGSFQFGAMPAGTYEVRLERGAPHGKVSFAAVQVKV